MDDFEIALIWCTKCETPVGYIITRVGDRFKEGRHYWFQNEAHPGTEAKVSEDGKYLYYPCPNCNEGHLLHWCPNAETPRSKLTYDPYSQPLDTVSDQDVNVFEKWLNGKEN